MACNCDSIALEPGEQANMHSSSLVLAGRQNNLLGGAVCWKLPRGPHQHFRRGAAWPYPHKQVTGQRIHTTKPVDLLLESAGMIV